MARHVRARRLLLAIIPLLLAFVFTGCEAFSSPQNTFAPAGEVAEDQKNQFLFVMVPALFVMIGVLAACLLIPIFFRRKKGDPGLPKQVHGNTPLELTWTILPALLMVAVGVVTVAGIVDLGRAPSEDSLRVNVTGQRFSWLFEYPNLQDAEGNGLRGEINEMRIPVGREIGVYINSVDVNHSFWVPKLAGKTDAINNHENRMWLRADEEGVFAAQCAEFCGLNHSDMRFVVIAMPQDEFDAWVAEQGDYTEVMPTPEADDDEPVDEEDVQDGEDEEESERSQGN